MFFPPLILTIKIFNVRYNLLFLIFALFILNLQLVAGLVDGLVAVYFTLSSYLIYEIFINKQNSFYNLFIAFCFLVILSLLRNEGIVMILILYLILGTINISKEKILKNYKKIFFLLFSILPILTWKIACINYNIKNIIINSSIFNFNFLIGKVFDYNSIGLIFKFFILDTKFILSIIFILIAFKLNKNKTNFYFSLSIGMIYLFSLAIIFLIVPYDIVWTLETTVSRVIMSITLLFTFYGLLQIYKKQ